MKDKTMHKAVSLLRSAADDFSANLREEISPDNMKKVVQLNRKDRDCCHSHDFCDANMAMHAALAKNNLQSGNTDNPVWDTVWSLARNNDFQPLEV